MMTTDEKSTGEKKQGEILKEALCYNIKNGAETLNDNEIEKVLDFAEGYKLFLDGAKTEREAVRAAANRAIECGFKRFEYGAEYAAGEKVFYINRNKAIILAVIGKKKVDCGIRILAAHIDSPRLDLKPNPMFEEGGFAFFKTHYYGGIKKYQWPTIPLALHGTVINEKGCAIDVKVGEDESDPVFYISDLLPHLGADQSAKPLGTAIPGESLNAIIGTYPIQDKTASDRIKLAVLKLLNEKYGIKEEDFLSSELTLVPADKAKDVGFDRSLIGSYGHDDRVCAYPALEAILGVSDPEYTCMAVLTDKEEIGSVGNTGLNTNYMADFMSELCNSQKANPRKMFSNSTCLSADVNACYDPKFADCFEKQNSAMINCGVVVTKYTGSRGKSGTSDASAEFMGKIRNILNSAGVIWQTAELGKVDQGGGGTVAQYVAKFNIDVVDVGVPVLSMHAPYEVISKIDIYSAFRAFDAFLKA
ncbi:MAG: aminopeptidase [Oscillospiraceae bacterium]|nr:aminopeptidase [Oscillospiraceae bacterium]